MPMVKNKSNLVEEYETWLENIPKNTNLYEAVNVVHKNLKNFKELEQKDSLRQDASGK